MLKTFIKTRTCCPIVFHEEIIAVSQIKNLELTPKMTQKIANFKVSMHFLLKFRQTSWIGTFKRVNKGIGW